MIRKLNLKERDEFSARFESFPFLYDLPKCLQNEVVLCVIFVVASTTTTTRRASSLLLLLLLLLRLAKSRLFNYLRKTKSIYLDRYTHISVALLKSICTRVGAYAYVLVPARI